MYGSGENQVALRLLRRGAGLTFYESCQSRGLIDSPLDRLVGPWSKPDTDTMAEVETTP